MLLIFNIFLTIEYYNGQRYYYNGYLYICIHYNIVKYIIIIIIIR